MLYLFLVFQFHSQVQANRHAADSRIPFEYCYDLRLSYVTNTFYQNFCLYLLPIHDKMTKVNLYSYNEARIQTPAISLRTVGGSMFPAIDPGQVISIQVLRASDYVIL